MVGKRGQEYVLSRSGSAEASDRASPREVIGARGREAHQMTYERHAYEGIHWRIWRHWKQTSKHKAWFVIRKANVETYKYTCLGKIVAWTHLLLLASQEKGPCRVNEVDQSNWEFSILVVMGISMMGSLGTWPLVGLGIWMMVELGTWPLVGLGIWKLMGIWMMTGLETWPLEGLAIWMMAGLGTLPMISLKMWKITGLRTWLLMGLGTWKEQCRLFFFFFSKLICWYSRSLLHRWLCRVPCGAASLV